MYAKGLLFVPMIFLGAAAAPQADCGALAASEATLPTALDLAGRPAEPSGLTGQVYAALPTAPPMQGCLSPLPSAAAASATLKSDNDDVLHGLPSPEILRPLHEPKQAPLIAR